MTWILSSSPLRGTSAQAFLFSLLDLRLLSPHSRLVYEDQPTLDRLETSWSSLASQPHLNLHPSLPKMPLFGVNPAAEEGLAAVGAVLRSIQVSFYLDREISRG
jgi:hypothetical protein